MLRDEIQASPNAKCYQSAIDRRVQDQQRDETFESLKPQDGKPRCTQHDQRHACCGWKRWLPDRGHEQRQSADDFREPARAAVRSQLRIREVMRHGGGPLVRSNDFFQCDWPWWICRIRAMLGCWLWGMPARITCPRLGVPCRTHRCLLPGAAGRCVCGRRPPCRGRSLGSTSSLRSAF
jgi:hypothetical protein